MLLIYFRLEFSKDFGKASCGLEVLGVALGVMAGVSKMGRKEIVGYHVQRLFVCHTELRFRLGWRFGSVGIVVDIVVGMAINVITLIVEQRG